MALVGEGSPVFSLPSADVAMGYRLFNFGQSDGQKMVFCCDSFSSLIFFFFKAGAIFSPHEPWCSRRGGAAPVRSQAPELGRGSLS